MKHIDYSVSNYIQKMQQEIKVFNKIIEEYGYSKAEIGRIAGIDRVSLSRFLNGHQDISLSRFFKLISSMPSSFQEAYWKEVLGYKTLEIGDRPDWDELIERTDFDDLQKILRAISDRWTELTNKKTDKKTDKKKELIKL